MDSAEASRRIEEASRRHVLDVLRRKGAVVGLSGGIDSSVVAALCARALGEGRVLGVMMPDRDSSDDALRLGRMLAQSCGIEALTEDVTSAAEAIGCYRRQAEAIRKVFPDYGEGWKCKLSMPPILDGDRLNITYLTVQSPDGTVSRSRLPVEAYRQLVAATNFKQRLRQVMLYYHADRLSYAVAGTSNRLEHDQGFFVKLGDGSADFKPIAHLYKTQIYALAEYLGVPEEIRRRPPTTDTFSLPQTQEEFFYSIPHTSLDLCIYAKDHAVPLQDVAQALGWTEGQVARVFDDIDRKRRTTRYLRLDSLTVEADGWE